ncbi:beta-lactamase superfamily II metal-dependent hydrolase [Chryseobacterium geocarposphaerae]|uniref:Beta-lactamase superfamily II metal-dependent hydrolase n=2 Tax=Chryseobacterium geocarposphaerae TaxID=1416776 RepID=A0A2M9BXG6_9FLAO|nr:beta-lactamase superfamily II metal-dependent hydrolase [Chryseobacterium geocarposphaerae]
MLIKILKAGNGDSILLKLDNNFNILIDGGNNIHDYKHNLKQEILEIQKRKEFIDLIIITHIDQDHIKGIEYLLKDEEISNDIIKNCWFNSVSSSTTVNNDISYDEALRVESIINSLNIPINRQITLEQTPKISLFGINFSILSPYKKDIENLILKNTDISSSSTDYKLSLQEILDKNPRIFADKIENLDTSVENKSSIAFLLEYKSKKILFLGDAESTVLHQSLEKILNERGINELDIDYLKLSHHGSHKSLSMNLFNYIKCNNFIISANGKKENLPNKLTFAKILTRINKKDAEDNFYFNYSSVLKDLNFLQEEKKEFKFECYSENFEHGYKIEL